jgi:subtilisin-like proprotein convertase family protein
MARRDREYGGLMRRLLLVVPIALLALSGSAPAATTTYTSHQLHLGIPAGNTVQSTIPVADSGPVSFVAVGVRIVHPRDSDLTISLVSPHGTAIPLSAGRGGEGANFGTGPKGCSGELTWFESDGLDSIITAKAPFAGEFRPEKPLTALNGQEARGRWSLRVDAAAGGATGMLLCWQLELSRNVLSHIRLARDGLSADFTYRESNSNYSDLRLAIHRHGKLAFDGTVAAAGCGGCALSGLSTIQGDPLLIRDLDGDGEPEVLVDLFSGGAHCCWLTVFFRYDGHGYLKTTHVWGDPAYQLKDLDGDGRPELVSADDRFAYEFTFYAASALPVQIWHFDRGVLIDVTSNYPAVVRKDAATLWSEYLQTRHESGADVRGVLAAWLADEYRLGLADQGWKKIDTAYAAGEVSPPRVDALWPAGKKYLTALRAFLAKTGYAG